MESSSMNTPSSRASRKPASLALRPSRNKAQLTLTILSVEYADDLVDTFKSSPHIHVEEDAEVKTQ